MNIIKRLSAFAMALVLIAAMAVTVSAAEAEPGKTVTVSFSAPSVYGIDGYFEYSNKAIFSGMSYHNNSSLAGDIANDRVFLYGSSESNVVIEIAVTVKAGAKVGDSCQITFTYETSDADGQMSDWKSQTQTVTVKKAEKAETTAAPTPETTHPSNPEVTEPAPPETTAQPVTEPPADTTDKQGPGVDYTELVRQINVAKSLDENEYTAESWEAMMKAFNAASGSTSSKNQADVDAAALDLDRAISALVKVDHTDLLRAVEAAKALGDIPAHGALWEKLHDALARSEAVLAGRDQADVDALVKELNGLIEDIQKDSETLGGDVVEVVREVEKLPDGDYCNIHMHKVWPVLFFITLAVCLILVALIVWFLIKRKNNQKDDTPIVDYDIGDDE